MKKAKAFMVTQLGDPVLRRKCEKVTHFNKEDLQELASNLIATCKESNGVGIAAPQVDESIQMFILWSQSNDRYPDAPNMEPEVVINPKIIKKSRAIQSDWEGCLSIPGVRARVKRHKTIDVEYYNLEGKMIRKKFSHPFVARVFQHEYDHLQGKVFLDRVSSKDVVMEKEYKKELAKEKKKIE